MKLKHVRTRLRRGRLAPDRETTAETPVERVLAIAAALGRILAAMVFKPHRLDEKINGDAGVQRSVPKYTFLTVCVFSAVKACKFLLMLFILANLFWLRGCDPVTQQPAVAPDLARHLNIPGLQDILLVGLPSALLILGLLAVLRALLRQALGGDAAQRFFNVAVYIVGFEYLVLAFALAGSLPFHTSANRISMLGLVPFAILLFVLAWGTILLTITVMRVARVAGRKRAWYARLPHAVGAFLLMTAWNAGIVGTVPLLAFPLAANEVQPELNKPVLSLSLLHASAGAEGKLRFVVAVTNLGREHRYLLHTELGVLFDNLAQPMAGCSQGKLFVGRVEEWKDSPAGGTMLAPNGVLRLTVDLRRKQEQGCDMATWRVPQAGQDGGLGEFLSGGVWNYPVPKNYQARVAFQSVNVQTGARGRLVGFLLGEPGFVLEGAAPN